MQSVRLPEAFLDRESFYRFDDFFNLITLQDGWTTLVADTTPTAAVIDGSGGILQLFTDTTDNNEVAVRTTWELFKPAANKSYWGAARIQYTENDTNKANVFVGFCSALGVNTIGDNGGVVRASGSIFGIYKLDGGTVWRAHSRNGTDTAPTSGTAQDSVSLTTAGGSSYQELEIFISPHSTTQCKARYKVDGEFLRDASDPDSKEITHYINYASNTEMNFGIYVKSGGGAGGETLLADWAAFAGNR